MDVSGVYKNCFRGLTTVEDNCVFIAPSHFPRNIYQLKELVDYVYILFQRKSQEKNRQLILATDAFLLTVLLGVAMYDKLL